MKSISACALLNNNVNIAIDKLEFLAQINVELQYESYENRIKTTQFCNRVVLYFIAQQFQCLKLRLFHTYYPYCMCHDGLLNEKCIKNLLHSEAVSTAYCYICNAMKHGRLDKCKIELMKDNKYACICPK